MRGLHECAASLLPAAVVFCAVTLVCLAVAKLQAGQMSGAFFFAVGTIGRSTRQGRKPSTLLQAARHNRRKIQAELGARSHIDAGRTSLNETIAGPDTPEAVVALALALLMGAGVDVAKLRKDYTQAIEMLFSLAPDSTVNTGDYFRRCVAWAGGHFGAANILSADIHRDEASPHCHILILPMAEGRHRGSALITRPKLAKLRESFAKDVARAFGLKAPPGRMAGALREQAVRRVLDRLESTQDAILESGLWLTVRRDIEHDPARFVAALGIELTAVLTRPKPKTVVKIFISAGKGPKVDKTSNPAKEQEALKPIGFEHVRVSKPTRHRNLCSVGFEPEAPPFSPTKPLPDAPTHETTRVHDCDLSPAMFDPVTGDYCQPPLAPARRQRQAADAWVTAALSTRQQDRTKSLSRHA